ncbi:MAG: epoxyqueuosine reductase QueH [Patescibacteria group bacterium]
MDYFWPAIFAFILSWVLTILVRKIALKFNIIDQPDGARKVHKLATPLLGGVAIFIAYFLTLLLVRSELLSGGLSYQPWLGFFAGALILIIGGILDDKYNLPPKWQIIFPILAVLILIIGGVNIEKISNPFGGWIFLSSWALASPVLIFLWLMGMMYTTKLLDGLDGLVGGLSAIGGLVIFLFTLTTRYYQPDIALAALILSAVCLGFLVLNFNPAKIFLGEGGSLLLGYILGVLAIISGGKIAIALLVMGLPVLDLVWTIIRRLAKRQNPFKSADREHLHHRLLSLGLSQKQTVVVFYSFSLLFGLSALFLQSQGKFLALVVLLVLMMLIIISFSRLKKLPAKPDHEGLLLHICCAPCGAYPSQEILAPQYDLTLYFYNPNLLSQEEFDKRLSYVKELAARNNWPLIVEPYAHEAWRDRVRGLETETEGAKRCELCLSDRLERTAILAKTKGFKVFATTLAFSPFKNQAFIRQAALEIAAKHGLEFLDRDWPVQDIYRRSQDLAKSLGFYRQKFCGCEYAFKSTKKK